MSARAAIVGANLLFASKVLETARTLGIEAASVPVEAELGDAQLVFLDLEKIGVEGVRAIRSRTRAQLIGFAGHALEQLIADARDAGCDQILTRGQLAAQLPKLLEAIAR